MSDLHLDRLLKIFMVISCITIICCGEIQARIVTFSHIQELKINEGEKGSFRLFNTSETRFLFGDHIWGITIGATWNLTVHLHSNSTSGILVSFLSLDPLWYSGIKEFGVSPGQTFSENYTQHGMSDSIPYFNFNYSLIE
ncbi:MAG: hypothetical protein ACFFAU_19120, partial [Candidatus Hodarchaeota archaeon]